ncbi:Glu-tRNA(Gln) amidotransferase subunit GatE [Candidatus Woesearchaeota archaeon]|jgi:Glu-tRNA(Gln) amidotransferase subunit E-like FAD-binding protein|nr:Glu-tRNA(Gln) amidotransferase subunit GatE [Candidatus Woesearchaeota archaeon]MBT4321966.1 Glu-tRNA(Gln) amidotransferase subunit GatE [Candidatus Woesearchaeota archaeon]MBT4631318.1 Glu-tRNA(Gln) amidotransferase subunit GatE [Candidatus Woesearchaeota archaeon]
MDYKKLKFKAGLEIHQQLETNKLFCSCPSILRDEKPDILIKRKLRSSEGESGKKDVAAEYETSKDKEFIYQGYKDSNCSVEYDEEPPHDMNEDALEIVLQVCLLLKCKLVDEIQVMRKVVVDGSNTSGFQRTALVGYGGYLGTSKGKVGIASVAVEEDAARRIKDDKNSVTFRLDRLGIPLIEIATDPDIKDPEHAKETAEKLGMILRSTAKVKRGLGTIRQDVNVSIKNGNRVEIKGFQDLRSMIKIIENEVKRQSKGNVKKEVRKAESDFSTSFLRPMPGAARMYPETDVKPILITKELLKSIELPELLDEKVLKLEKQGVNPDLARILVKDGIFLDEFEYSLDKNLIASVLVEMPKDIKKRFNLDYYFSKDDFILVLENLDNGNLNKESAFEVLTDIAQEKKIDMSKYKQIDFKDLEKDIKAIVEKNKKLSVGALMGIVMNKYRGKVEGRVVSELIRKYL